MGKINLFYKICEYWPELHPDLINELLDDSIINTCVIYHAPTRHKVQINHSNVTVIPPDPYELLVDWNEIPALDKELLEKMLPYESMAIKMGMRRKNLPIAEYETEKRNYYRHLRFLNYIFGKYKINLCFFQAVPHQPQTYIAYALAKVRNIPILLTTISTISRLHVLGHGSIEETGSEVGEYYNSIKNVPINEIELSGKVKEYYDIHSRALEEIKKTVNPGKDKASKEAVNRVKDVFFESTFGKSVFLKPQRMYIRLLLASLVKTGNLKRFRSLKNQCVQEEKLLRDARFFRRKIGVSVKKYNKFAKCADFSQKYIYYALQLTPEETTMPRAGVFAEQYNAIQLLARCARNNNVLIYVKEHYVQPYRECQFYEDLRKIENVCLIKTTESTYDIMKNALAVATQTGSCVLEGILMQKPAIVFSAGCTWKNAPGMYEISNEKEGTVLIDRICKHEISIHPEEVKRYFYAIEKKSYDIDYLREDIANEKEELKRIITDFVHEESK